MSPVRETLATNFWHLIAVICIVAIVPGDTLAELPSFQAQSPYASAKAQAPVCINHQCATPSKVAREHRAAAAGSVSLGSGDTFVDQDLNHYSTVLGPTCLSLVRCR